VIIRVLLVERFEIVECISMGVRAKLNEAGSTRFICDFSIEIDEWEISSRQPAIL